MWIIVAYYTKNTYYEEYVEKLRLSLKKLSLPYDLVGIENKGDWYANMQYKPVFLSKALQRHHPKSIIYVDCDAVFCRYPALFDKLDGLPNVNVAVHLLDHSKYRRKQHLPELLSGTIFLKNTDTTKKIVNEWISECKKNSKLWDQIALANILKRYRYHLLPEEYCVIFDYMGSVKDPVIKHFQASREARQREVVVGKASVGKGPSAVHIQKKARRAGPRKRTNSSRIRRSSIFF